VALNDKKIPPDLKPDPRLTADLEAGKDADGKVACAAAFIVAERKGVSPQEVGRTLDALSVPLTHCQLGLFGYPGHAKGWGPAGVASQAEPRGLRDALREAAGPNQTITCEAIWKAAERFRASRMLAGYIADLSGLKIIGCQLGAF